MKLKIGDYEITQDTYCYTLSHKHVVSDVKSKHYGNTTEVVLGYYSKLEHLLRAMIDRELLDRDEVEDINDAIQNTLKRLERLIEENN